MIYSKLLDEIAANSMVVCLSDLHNLSPQQLKEAVCAIDATKYTIQQWGYTLSYILSEQITINLIDDIVMVLEKRCEDG